MNVVRCYACRSIAKAWHSIAHHSLACNTIPITSIAMKSNGFNWVWRGDETKNLPSESISDQMIRSNAGHLLIPQSSWSGGSPVLWPMMMRWYIYCIRYWKCQIPNREYLHAFASIGHIVSAHTTFYAKSHNSFVSHIFCSRYTSTVVDSAPGSPRRHEVYHVHCTSQWTCLTYS